MLTTTAIALASGSQYTVIYQFQGGQDGYYPAATMIADKAGNLYGTTVYGGSSGSCEGQNAQGCGTVFQLARPATAGGAWTETAIYRFQGASDGAFPQAPMIADGQGNLYGTTTNGGGSANCDAGCGTVFKLEPPAAPDGAWTESLLYTFQGVPGNRNNGDAASPNGLVFDKAGDLYGLAYGGGHCHTVDSQTYCYGAVYKLTAPRSPGAGWTERVLYRFTGPSGGPVGPILDPAGNLYGAAGWGQFGFGMIFRVVPPSSAGGIVDVAPVYSFHGGSDGAFPLAGLVFDRTGRLYGSTFGGGPINSGTVFQLSPPAQPGSAWSESVLYGFTARPDANTPAGGLVIGKAGKLFGATQYGGQNDVGAVFELTPPSTQDDSWTEIVLQSLDAGDGSVPLAGPTMGRNGALYGTASAGGSTGSGLCVMYQANTCGVVFQIVP